MAAAVGGFADLNWFQKGPVAAAALWPVVQESESELAEVVELVVIEADSEEPGWGAMEAVGWSVLVLAVVAGLVAVAVAPATLRAAFVEPDVADVEP